MYNVDRKYFHLFEKVQKFANVVFAICLLYPQPLPERRPRDLYLSQLGFFKQYLNKNGTNENGERVIIMRKKSVVCIMLL